MSSNQDRLKLPAKRGKNPSESKQSYTVHENEQKNIGKGLKRRLSSETDISSKKMRQTTNVETAANRKNKSVQPSTSRDLDPVKNKSAEYSKNKATSRLTLLKEKFKKDILTTSKSDDKNTIKKSSNITSQNVSQPIKKEFKNVSQPIKKEFKNVSQPTKKEFKNVSQPTKKEFKNVSQPIKNESKSSYRIPKKTVNDRLKIAKEVNLVSEKTDQKSTVSPVKMSDSIQERGDKGKAYISPLKRARSVPYNKRDEHANPTRNKSDTSFRLSSEYIIISEASDSESSSKTLTPINQRLSQIENDHISIYEKTLTPGSDQKSDAECCFKTPKPQALRVPLNRSLFKNRLETVKTERNIFESSKSESTKVELKHSSEHRTSIFGATVSPSTFQNTTSKTEDNIFSTKAPNLSYNNNDLSPTNLNYNTNSGNIVDLTTSQSPTNIFSVQNRLSDITKIQNEENLEDKSSAKPIIRHDAKSSNIFANTTAQSPFKTSSNIFNAPNHTANTPEPERREIRPDKSHNIFSSKQISRGSLDITKTQSGENLEDKSSTNHHFRHDDTKSSNIFANTTARSPFKTSSNIFNAPNHTANTPEPERRENLPDKSHNIFAPKQNSRGSISNRLARIRSGEVSSYGRKPENAENDIIEILDSNEVMEQRRMEPSAMQVGFQEQSRLQTVPSCSKELLTEQWLKSEQCTSVTIDESMSDSMNVNVNDSILNKTELVDPVEDVSMDWDSVPEEPDVPQPGEPPKPPEKKKENAICVVTDTNVFMHSLPKIKEILNIKLSGTQKICVFIPWMVMVELDHLKDHSPQPTKSIALEAQRYINKNLEAADSRLIGQSIDDLTHQKDIGKDPDDKILSACLQAVERFKTVIFLTADINLRNKAMINKIEACPPKDIMGRLNVALSKNVKYCEIRRKLGTLCSMIICDLCSAAYGEVWKKMDMLQNPPWSLVECTKRLIKYWSSVFRGDLLKHSQKYIRDLHDFLLKHKDDVMDDSDRFNEFVKLAVHLMFYLRDLPNHKNATQKTMEEIVQIADGR